MPLPISKPSVEQVPQFYRGYVAELESDDLIEALRTEQILLRELLRPLNEERAESRYAEGKWSIKELVSHLLDAEWVFAFRALCFARGERQKLPGFDEDAYVAASRADARALASLCEEMEHLRGATIALFAAMDDDQLDAVGNSNGLEMTPRSYGWIIAGHAAHHRKVIAERYL